MNNIDVTTDPADQTTWAKPILLGVYDFQGKYIPENGDFYIKDNAPAIIPKVQVIYKVGDETVKTTEASVEPINLDEQAPRVENLAHWSYQSSIGYNPVVSPIEGQELNLITVYGVLNGADGQDGATGPQGEQGVQGETGPQGEQGPQGEPGKDGVDGKDGTDGKNGEKGDTGEKGEKGDTGEAGINGKDGEKGEKGDKGDPGTNGKNGINGKDGVTKTVVVSDNPRASTDKLPKTGDSSIIFWIIGIIIAAGICSAIALNKTRN